MKDQQESGKRQHFFSQEFKDEEGMSQKEVQLTMA